MSKFFTLDNFQYVYGKIKEIYATQENVNAVETDLATLKDTAVTQEDLKTAIAEAGAATLTVVEELPEEGDAGVIYLLKKEDPGEEGETPVTSYTQYIYQDGEWQAIGQADIDLSNYITKSELDFATEADIDAIMNPVVEEEPAEEGEEPSEA